MRQLTLIAIAIMASSAWAFADSAATVKPLPFNDFNRIVGARSVTIDAPTKGLILKSADGIEPHSPQISLVVKALRDDAKEISLEALVLLLESERGQAVSEQMAKHDDPVVRFVANIVLSASGNSDAAKAIYALIHDESLSRIDKRLIRTWCGGVGLRAGKDDAAAILGHLTVAMGEESTLKHGDVVPDFIANTTKGRKLSSLELKGKVIVVHFWATWCAPCVAKMPSHINALSEYDSKALEVLYVSLDEDKDAFEAAVAKLRIPFTMVREPAGWGGNLARTFGVNSVPFDVVVGPDGKVFSNSIEDVGAALAKTAEAEQ